MSGHDQSVMGRIGIDLIADEVQGAKGVMEARPLTLKDILGVLTKRQKHKHGMYDSSQ